MTTDLGHVKLRMNVEGDRLSRLPDDLIHKILSFIDIKEAIGTSVLSSRWRFIWTSMPYLNFSTEDFSTLLKFSKFVTNVLSQRNDQTEVYSVNLSFHGRLSQVFVKRILNYAFSHNIQQLNVVFLIDRVIEFPLSIFSSQSLKHLSLTMQERKSRRYFVVNRYLTSTWELPALTTLELHYVTLRDDNAEKCIGVFTKCANLKNLTLNDFKTLGSDSFRICHPRLTDLTLQYGCKSVKVVNVSAPQLKNLTIRFCVGEHVISAPDLASLFYEGYCPLNLSVTEGFLFLEKAHICVISPNDAHAHQIICLLQQLHSVKFLTLNMEILEILSSSADLILHQPSPFVNLKSLKFYPQFCYNQTGKKAIMSTKLKSYFLDSSPGCTFTMVLREEIRVQNIMAELGVILEKEIVNTKTDPMLLKTEGKMARIKSCWNNMDVQIRKATDIMSKMQLIEEIVTKLPASNRAKIQPCVSGLCGKAHIVISKITDSMKIQCDENQSLTSVCFHELATKLGPAS